MKKVTPVLDKLLLALKTECFDHLSWGNARNIYPVECFSFDLSNLILSLIIFNTILLNLILCYMQTRDTIVSSTQYIHTNGYNYFNVFTVFLLVLITSRHENVIHSWITNTTPTPQKKINIWCKLIGWKAWSMYTYTTDNHEKVHSRPTQPSKRITQHYKVLAL